MNSGPFIRSDNTTNKVMKNLLISLLPVILFSIYKNGYIPYYKNYIDTFHIFYPLIFILIGGISSYLFEIIFTLIFKKRDIKYTLFNGYGFFPGLFLAMILPLKTPIIVLIIGCFFASIIGKMVYGGIGNNVFNPALVGYIILLVCYSQLISTSYLNPYELSISSATPLTNLKLVESLNYTNLVGKYGSLFNFFIGTIPGSLCETSALCCLLSFVYLTIKKVIKPCIPVFYIFTVFALTLVIGLINNLGLWYPLFEILSGGLFFGAIFMATDPVTSPVTKKGQIIYGILLGILTTVFRYLTSAPEGVMLAILTMNMFVFIIDKIGYKSINKVKYFVITIIILLLISLGITYYIATNLTSDTKDSNYNILDSKKVNEELIYTVTQKGNGGLIKAEIIFKDNKIININILEHNETEAYFKKVLDLDYVNDLIIYQDSISEVDTVSGATISSSALKKMVTNTIKDYGDNYER